MISSTNLNFNVQCMKHTFLNNIGQRTYVWHRACIWFQFCHVQHMWYWVRKFTSLSLWIIPRTVDIRYKIFYYKIFRCENIQAVHKFYLLKAISFTRAPKLVKISIEYSRWSTNVYLYYYESVTTRGFHVGSSQVIKFDFKDSPLLCWQGLPMDMQNLGGRPPLATLVQPKAVGLEGRQPRW